MGVGVSAEKAAVYVNSNIGRYSKFLVVLAGAVLTGIFAGFSSKAGISADVTAGLVYLIPNAQKLLSGSSTPPTP